MITDDQRRIWADTRASSHLTPGDEEFARTGLMEWLDEPRLLVRVLPASPLAVDLDFTDDLTTAVLPQRFEGLMSNGVSVLDRHVRTANAACNVSSREANARAYVAVRRDGGVEAGAGAVLSYRAGSEEPTRYRLHVIVHLIRQVLEAQTRLIRHVIALGQHELTAGAFEVLVALPGAQGALLDSYAEGWEPTERLFPEDVPQCLESDVLIRLDIDGWPDAAAGLEALLIRIAARVSDAFNDPHRRFLVASGASMGTLQRTYA